MTGAPPSAREREELEAILGSETLSHAPSVLRLMQYIGQSYLEGRANELKEYTIAVELLGKPPEFDPERDSVVRVLAHRLRRKLKLYYESEGAESTLELVLDPGQYVPHFVNRTPLPKPEPEAPREEPPAPLPVLPEPPVPRRGFPYARAAVAAICFALAVGWLIWRSGRDPGRVADGEIRIQAGAPVAVVSSDRLGNMWLSDRWYRGGEGRVAAEGEEIPVQFVRSGDFDYDIPLASGPHELRLYFGLDQGRPRTRRFDVTANGVKILDASDPAALHSGDPLLIRVFRDVGPAKDGKLHLGFRSGADTAFVNAISLCPGIRGRLKPIRLIMRNAPYRAQSGELWDADRYVTGGELVARTDPVAGGSDQNLFSGERHGTFSYHVPVARGTYRLTFYFAERWFGRESGGGAGSRRFDVHANGTPLLEDFDIYKEAGGANRGIRRQFQGIPATGDGYIDISFEPRANRACISAIELEDESR